MEESAMKRLRVQITEKELLCKNKCGFYGTPQWNGLCSKCWRESHIHKKQTIDYDKNRSLLSEKNDDSRSSRIKSLLRKSPSMFSPSTSVESQLSSYANNYNNLPPGIEISSIQGQFYDYIIDNFGYQIAKDIDKLCRSVLERVYQHQRLSLDEISEFLQQNYQMMKERIGKLRPLKDNFSINYFMCEFEEYICTNAYDIIFSNRTEEEAADLSIQDRIRSLHWVTSGFLETAFDFTILAVDKYVDEAITHIIEMNQYRSVQQKLDCLIKCSKSIFDALKESRAGAPASADEFLPGLIYVILRANPPLILSNMKFISRFALPLRIMRGESGYYFTNLSCAVQFIQDMNADSLHMDKEEFEAYTSGQLTVPFRNFEPGRNLAIKSVENGLKLFDDLFNEQTQLNAGITAVFKLMDHNAENYGQEVDGLLKEHPSREVLQFCQLLHEDDVKPTPVPTQMKLEVDNDNKNVSTMTTELAQVSFENNDNGKSYQEAIPNSLLNAD